MTLWKQLACGLIVGYAAVTGSARAEEPQDPPVVEAPAAKPRVDLVFVLDTTGSMGGLLEGAKRKIWSITNEVLKGKPTPEVRIGLVAYRDKRDAYVTKTTDLTDDLDGIYKELMSFKAKGGGDGPEHVNAGLKDAIETMSWSQDKEALRIIFLVGDAPPHEDYGDAFDHKSLAKQAIEKDIIINTIRCGSDPQTGAYWAEISKRAEGTFMSIAQDGGVAAIATPYDKELAELGVRLDGTVAVAGDARLRREAADDKAGTMKALEAAPEEAKADRAAAAGRGGGAAAPAGAKDLVEEFAEHGDAALEGTKENELPDEMQKMTEEERKAWLEQKAKERAELKTKIDELDRKRAEFIKEELKKQGGKDSFDSAVKDAIHEQGKRKGFRWEE